MSIGKSYTEGLYYQIRLTARYLKLFGVQLFDGLGIDVPFDEFIALDIISSNKDLCQRDLAKLILKDRANTGRIIKSIENRGLIKVSIDKKQNRLVKILSLTKEGQKFLDETLTRINPYIEHIKKSFDYDCEGQLINVLTDIRQKLSELVETQI